MRARAAYSSATFRNADGWIVKPVGFQSGKKYPLIVEIHGGPHAAHTDGDTMIHFVKADVLARGEQDLEELAWKQLARRRLTSAWEEEEDALYDYL